ncbi:MAG: hypothetical protein K2X87_07160 [Gemmataceae bacterium]|nr:hypothetical protein [Gemmataceae bacterium]
MAETARGDRLIFSPSGMSVSLPYARLAEVRDRLDAHGVRYWVSPVAITLGNDPEVTFVYFGQKEDPAAVRQLLDSLP